MLNSENDYLLEKKLMKEAPELHKIFSDCIISFDRILDGYVKWFPTWTDHSINHALNVVNLCNHIIGKTNIEKINSDEAFILLMAMFFHDIGMGLSKEDYLEFAPQISDEVFPADNEQAAAKYIREHHHELSALFVMKYGDSFNIPSPEYKFAIAQAAKGHRRTDLFDKNEYPENYQIPDGKKICLPCLAALIRLSDEIDVAVDRNMIGLYKQSVNFDDHQIMEFQRHKAVKSVVIAEKDIYVNVDTRDKSLLTSIENEVEKMKDTLEYCRKAVRIKPGFNILQEDLIIKRY